MGFGSEIRDPGKPIPDPGPGVKKAPDPGSATLFCVHSCNMKCCGSGSACFLTMLGSRIRIKVESRIRIPNKVKIQELWRLKKVL
jgi:hypothetical protein